MPEPHTEKQVWGFLGRLNYIARFISQLTPTCEPIFKLLRKNQAVPVLMPPVTGRPLFLYMTVLDESMGCVLGQHDDSGKKGASHLLSEQEVYRI